MSLSFASSNSSSMNFHLPKGMKTKIFIMEQHRRNSYFPLVLFRATATIRYKRESTPKIMTMKVKTVQDTQLVNWVSPISHIRPTCRPRRATKRERNSKTPKNLLAPLVNCILSYL